MIWVLFILIAIFYSMKFTKLYVNEIRGNIRYDGDHQLWWLHVRNWMYHIIISMISCLAFIILLLVISKISGNWMTETIETKINTIEINPLKEQFTENGGWYYDTGTVEGELSYFYAINTKNGEAIRHVSTFDCYINYDDNVTPNITFYEKSRKLTDFWQAMAIIDVDISEKSDKEEYAIITIPESAKDYKGFNFD